MIPSKNFTLFFSKLKSPEDNFYYHLDKMFFECLGFNDFTSANFDIHLKVKEVSQVQYELFFDFKGTAGFNCDVSGDLFEMPINGKENLILKFGKESIEDIGLIVLPYGVNSIDIQKHLYEIIVLSIPQKRVSPVLPQNRNCLFEYPPEQSLNAKASSWDKLKNLIK